MAQDREELLPCQPEATVTLQGPKGPIGVDASIAPLVEALNAAGIATKASCSGHGFRPGNIALADGRELVIARDFDEARKIDALFPLNIQGERVSPNPPAQGDVTRHADVLRTLLQSGGETWLSSEQEGALQAALNALAALPRTGEPVAWQVNDCGWREINDPDWWREQGYEVRALGVLPFAHPVPEQHGWREGCTGVRSDSDVQA